MSYFLTDKKEYAFTHSNDEILFTTKLVAICYDKDTMTLHKHGTPNSVNSWMNTAHQKLSDAGFSNEANALIVVQGPFNVDDLNNLLACNGSLSKFLTKYNLI